MKIIDKKEIKSLKNKPLGMRKIWTIFCISFIGSVLLFEALFSWFFVKTINRIDADEVADIKTNGRKILLMGKTLDNVESAINERTGKDFNSSQIYSEVLE